MKGFTLIEFIVVAAIVAIVSVFGMRYYFTSVESYRFQNAISEFKAAVNLARARSMSGIVTSTGALGDTSTAIPVKQISYSDPTSVKLTTTAPHKLTKDMLPAYLTLMGFYPADETLFATNLFPYYVNGPQCKVKDVLGEDALVVDAGVPIPSYVDTGLKQTAYAFMNYAVNIRAVESIEGGGYAKAYETGPAMDFQYRKDVMLVRFTISDPTLSTPKEEGSIVFRKGITVGEKTYSVSFDLAKSPGGPYKVSFTILPAGALR